MNLQLLENSVAIVVEINSKQDGLDINKTIDSMLSLGQGICYNLFVVISLSFDFLNSNKNSGLATSLFNLVNVNKTNFGSLSLVMQLEDQGQKVLDEFNFVSALASCRAENGMLCEFLLKCDSGFLVDKLSLDTITNKKLGFISLFGKRAFYSTLKFSDKVGNSYESFIDMVEKNLVEV